MKTKTKQAIAGVALLLVTVLSANAQGYYYSTPRFGGGYNWYGSDGSSGYATPRFNGGYNFYNSDGSSGYSTPRFNGGYNYYFTNPTYPTYPTNPSYPR